MIRVNGKEMPWRRDLTIQQVLQECGFTFRMIAVWINGIPYTEDQFSRVCVEDGADFQALHMISGG